MIAATDYPFNVRLRAVLARCSNLKSIMNAPVLNADTVDEWFRLNLCGDFRIVATRSFYHVEYAFEREDDAILFLLRFGGTRV